MPDHTFGPSQYLDVTQLSIDKAGIRNEVEVVYLDEQGDVQTATAESATSIAKYGRRFMGLSAGTNSQIDNATDAQAYADGCLSDLSLPSADQEIELLFWPFAELTDLYRFEANGVHYDTNQDLAVVGIRHVLRNNQTRTYLRTRGKPAAAYRLWHLREVRRGVAPANVLPAKPTGITLTTGLEIVGQDTLTYLKAEWNRNLEPSLSHYRLRYRRYQGSTPLDWQYVDVPPAVNPEQKLSPLAGDRVYGVQVQAVTRGQGIAGPWSDEATATTAADTVAPATPAGLAVETRIQGIKFAFDRNSEVDMDHYRIFAAEADGEEYAGTATSATTSTLKETGAGWTVDEWEDAYVVILDGTGAGQARRIASNTEDELAIADEWDTTPDSTSEFVIYSLDNCLQKRAYDTTPLLDKLKIGADFYCWVEAVDTSGNISVPTDVEMAQAGIIKDVPYEIEHPSGMTRFDFVGAFLKDADDLENFYAARIAIGFASDGDHVPLEFERPPKVWIAPYRFQTYSPDHDDVAQAIESYVSDVSPSGFTVHAGLTELGGSPTPLNVNASFSSGNPWTSGLSGIDTRRVDIDIWLRACAWLAGRASCEVHQTYKIEYKEDSDPNWTEFGQFTESQFLMNESYIGILNPNAAQICKARTVNHSIPNLPPGQYQVRVSFVSHQQTNVVGSSGGFSTDRRVSTWTYFTDEVIVEGEVIYIAIEGGAEDEPEEE